MTALGVYIAIQTCCERVFGSSSLKGRTISLLGLGHVGERWLGGAPEPRQADRGRRQ